MRKIQILLLFALVLSSCSIFQSSRRMDMSPFAENTRTLFGEAIKIERPFQWKHINPQKRVPEFGEIARLAPPVLAALRGIVYYSNQVVAINNARLSEQDKVRVLANYLDEIMQKALIKEQADSMQLDLNRARKVLDNIRAAKNYLDAIAAAEPIIHSVVAAVLERIDDIQEKIPFIIAGFDREIEKDYAAPKENYTRLIRLQERTMLSLTRLYNAMIGDRDELEKMLEENSSISYFIPSADEATHEKFMKVENYLLGQVKVIDLMIGQLSDVKQKYIEKKDEVLTWRRELDEKILIAKTSLTIWARAHKNLGAGIPVPPLIDVAGMAGSLVGTAAKVVVP